MVYALFTSLRDSQILKIRSRVNDRCSLWGKLLSSMIRLRFERNLKSVFH